MKDVSASNPAPRQLTTRVKRLPSVKRPADRRRFFAQVLLPEWPPVEELGTGRWVGSPPQAAYGSAVEAMQVFRRHDSLASGMLGSQRLFHRSARQEVRWIQRDFWECLQWIRPIERGGRTVLHAPSGWHLLLFLTVLQQRCLREGFSLLFRGQADARWRLTSSLGRLSGREARIEVTTLALFREVLGCAAQRAGLLLDSSMFDAMAQHYGIRTHLLDFTTDPAVVIWFATRERKKAGAVYILPTAQALKQRARLVLPPPFVRRLYVQEGVFLDTSHATPEALERACQVVTFDHGIKPCYRAFRLGDPLRIYPFSPWIRQAVAESRKRAGSLVRRGMTDETLAREVNRVLERIGSPRFLRPCIYTLQHREWLEECYHALYRLAFAIHSSTGQNTLRRDVLGAFVEQNSDVCRTLAEHLSEHAKTASDPVDAALARWLRRLSGL